MNVSKDIGIFFSIQAIGIIVCMVLSFMSSLVEFSKTLVTPKARTSIKGKLAVILIPCTLFALLISLMVFNLREYAFNGKNFLEWLATNGEGITGCIYIVFLIILASTLLFGVFSLLKLLLGGIKPGK